MKFTLILLTLLFLLSCSKKQERWIAKKWKFEKIEVSVNGAPYTETPLNCQDDDIWIFEKDGTFTLNTGSNCSSNGVTGTWQIGADEKTIAFTYDGISGVYYDEIVELTRTNLVTVHDSGLIPTTYYKYYYTRADN